MSFDLSEFAAFIDLEFRAKFRSVIDQISLPVADRVDRYTCWPGLVVEAMDSDSGRLTLSFKTNPSKLRIGEYVYVNSLDVPPHQVISGPEGVIEALDTRQGICRIRAGYRQVHRFLGRFRIGQKLVLDLTLPTVHLNREMPMLALRLVSGDLGDAPRLRRIRRLMTGELRAESQKSALRDAAIDEADPTLRRLTPSQRRAFEAAVTRDFALIQGPPGTGKTHLLGLIVREFVRRGMKVGVCALTHHGINNLLLECLSHAEIPDVCKIGGREHGRIEGHGSRLRLVKSPGAFFRSKTTPAVTGFTQHAAFSPVARNLDGEAGADALPDRFDVLVFDEAGQLTVPAALMAMVQADRYVFAGDHKQLPPVVQTLRPGSGPARSVFQHLVEDAGHEAFLLEESFRLNAELVRFPSDAFYSGRLTSAPSAANRRLHLRGCKRFADLLDADRPSQLALVRHDSRSQEAPEEAALIAFLVKEAVDGGVPPEEIAVIAPHRRQNVKIREFLGRLGFHGPHPQVDTVERIQGQERDLVFLSMTLSDRDAMARGAEFLFLPNRFNVAITRARKKLVVTASPALFRALPRPEALVGAEPPLLHDLNVLKRWYFHHRTRAVDVTDRAFEALSELTRLGAAKDTPSTPSDTATRTSAKQISESGFGPS